LALFFFKGDGYNLALAPLGQNITLLVVTRHSFLEKA
jgi:hypothetical protein